ncbi:MAG: RecQ family ATP-dependent DNA helicase [Chromatiales bacterium]|nr:RecQ family ATP-dependent DNA helicase [Chromatiales bacterium]
MLDLEVSADGRIRDVGALRGDATLRVSDAKSSEDAVRRLDAFTEGAVFVVGHNIVAHDRRFIQGCLPGAAVLALPVVDTLYLSPLARPKRPYHPLVKDYKLVGTERSDPVEDCRLALQLLKDCWSILEQREREHPGLVSIYRSCFDDSDAPGGASPLRLNGTGRLLEALGGRMLARDRVVRGFQHFAGTKACPGGIRRNLPSLLDDPMTRPAAAYSLAWLTVAGTESVLPRWVHRTFPAAPRFLHSVRSTRCDDPGCAYCSMHHDPRAKLQTYFGFAGFRVTPARTDGEGLQELIVTRGMEKRAILAILPTGGGKSLCYQLPAIVHNERTGALTVVISPLQALMKDQVENLNRKTEAGSIAAALNGLLTMPERHDVLEGIRLGRHALLYVSPEQLRSRSLEAALRQREIAAWVFDEAHCISKWGHDFRPDYLYAARFIREFSEREGIEPAPVACFTATAKLDVREEIVAHFREALDQHLEELAADRVDRENLHYSVEEVLTPHKAARIHELLVEHLGEPSQAAPNGAAIVYAASRKRTEELAERLRARAWNVEHFHAGLDPPDKKRVQDAFIAGDLPVIVATNAFGMGIDKENVRLVVHAEVPGSIENYLQEAGRAGRDGEPAHCVLLFAKGDLETQFDLASRSRLTRRDIAQILRAIRRAKRRDAEEIVISPGELLRVPETEVTFDERERDASTKVKTAISWLERADFLLRDENRTRVFQGVLAVPDIDTAKSLMAKLRLPERARRRWLEVIREIRNADLREGIDADQLAHLPSFRHPESKVDDDVARRDRTATREILRTLDEMTAAGLLESGIYFSAWVRHKTRDRSLDRLARIVEVERAIVRLLRAEYPDASPGAEVEFSLALLQERLRVEEVKITRESAQTLLAGWARQGLGGAALVTVAIAGRNRLRVGFQVGWDGFREQLDLRARVGQIILDVLLAHAERQGLTGERLVRFSLEEIRRAIDGELGLAQQIGDRFDAIEKALLFLDEHHVIALEKGLAIFRQAMTIRLRDEAKGRRYSGRHYRPLQDHYEQRVFQIHAMGRYVEETRNGLGGSRRYVQRYFTMPAPDFRRHYFGDDPKMVEKATSRESYTQIVENLRNDAQAAIVTAPKERNLLVLAGPGSGKTRVVVHRCAWLLRIARIRPDRVLVICFNRSAMHELRVRLRDLVGDLARRVAVHTYHSLALRLTERSMAARTDAAGDEPIDFDGIIDEANRRLRGEEEVVGVEPDELRDRLLSGFEYVLVDEYQDIDARQYEMITHIALRAGGDEDSDRRAAILAVGDDDQSIYEWRDANVRFLHQFEEEFSAERHYLVENYRSTRHIIDASNALIAHNRDRMKMDHPIRVNSARANDSPGGEWEEIDTFARGYVSLLDVEDGVAQASAVLAEIERLRRLDPSPDWHDFAILGRTHEELATVRALLERQGVPVRRALRYGLPPLSRIREFDRLIAHLKTSASVEISVQDLRQRLSTICGAASLWTAMADRMLAGIEAELGAESCPVADAIEALHRGLLDHRRSQIVGDGVLVGTVHASKGLEFAHVAVLAGGWKGRSADYAPEARSRFHEEERRLYYVAMTRARKTLTLINRRDDPIPYAREFEGWSLRRRKIGVAEDESEDDTESSYSVFGMEDLYIDFAGGMPADHRIHRSLDSLQAGDPVTLKRGEAGRVFVRDCEGTSVARLSKAGAERLEQRQLRQIDEVRVLGVVSRRLEDCKPEYRGRIAVPAWELPILEMRHRRVPGVPG